MNVKDHFAFVEFDSPEAMQRAYQGERYRLAFDGILSGSCW
jgi:hypothetical protein